MKKLILVILMCLFCGIASAERFSNCIPFQGKNGKHYCYSDFGSTTTQWIVSIGWCEGQGFHMASLNELCDYDASSKLTGSSCPNMVDVAALPARDYWSSSTLANGYQVRGIIKNSDGTITFKNIGGKDYSGNAVICKMPD